MEKIIGQVDIPNKNNRVYPREMMANIIAKVNEGDTGLFGQIDMPSHERVALDKVSHIVRELRIDGNDIVGHVAILKTPQGEILEQLIKLGIPVDFRMHGYADVHEKDGIYMVENFKLISVNAVLDGA